MEEPDIDMLCPQSPPQELPVMGKDGDGKYASSRSLVTNSPQIWSETRPAQREHSELQTQPPSFPETMKYGCRIRTLCREEGPTSVGMIQLKGGSGGGALR